MSTTNCIIFIPNNVLFLLIAFDNIFSLPEIILVNSIQYILDLGLCFLLELNPLVLGEILKFQYGYGFSLFRFTGNF